jgi:hypothetical protein
MKVDPQLVKVVASLPDEELWITIRSLAKMKKITLSEKTPPQETLETLRRALADADKIDLGSALRILQHFKEKK